MNIFNDDFQDFICSLNKYQVEYMLVGGYAVIIRGYSRSTGDMDIWVNKSASNFNQLQLAITTFGLPSIAIPKDHFFSNQFDVFSFGKPPYAIKILTEVKGLEFEKAYLQSTIEIVDQIEVRVIHINQLIEAKKAAGRNKDLNEIENLPN